MDQDESRSAPGGFLASRQLLFGLIALQANFVTREQLLAAFDAWVRDKSVTLRDVLVQQQSLQADQREVLGQLVEKFLNKHAGNAEQSLAALSSISEIRPQLEALGDRDLALSLGRVGSEARPQ